MLRAPRLRGHQAAKSHIYKKMIKNKWKIHYHKLENLYYREIIYLNNRALAVPSGVRENYGKINCPDGSEIISNNLNTVSS